MDELQTSISTKNNAPRDDVLHKFLRQVGLILCGSLAAIGIQLWYINVNINLTFYKFYGYYVYTNEVSSIIYLAIMALLTLYSWRSWEEVLAAKSIEHDAPATTQKVLDAAVVDHSAEHDVNEPINRV